ncbi:MAG TPA: alpha/beta hydrolase [Pirellulales bacterium]|jgi:acetyl esterase/lipase
MIRRAGLLLLLAALIAPFPLERSATAGEIEVERDVEYSNPKDQHLKLNLARPSKIDGLAPAVVCIHGGGWTGGSRDGWQGTCEELARRGFVAVTVQYRFAPAHPFPAAIEDVQAAVRWVRSNADRLKVDPSRIGTLGDSAGGHLAQCLGVGADADRLASDAAAPSCRVQCVVNIYGPNDLTRHYRSNPNVDGLLKNFLGGDVEQARHNFILASPFYWVTPDAAPTLIIHGTKDDVVPFEQGEIMRDRLKAADVEVELLPIEGAGHGFQGPDREKAHAAMFDWLEKHLKPEKK